MSKKHIFLLPDDVVTSLFVEWSHVQLISFLDSACCNKTGRIIFWNLFKHKCVVLRNEEMGLTCETVTTPFGVDKGFWRRVEFQKRGTPHSHYLINEH
jgi:hypothetical protein